MVEVGSSVGTPAPPGAASASHGSRTSRRIQPRRGLPGGRAVVGALLVAAAAVAVVAAYLDATTGPTRAYVVATTTIEPGVRLASMADVSERFGTISLDLADEVALRAVPADEVESLVGQIVLAPMRSGDLLSRTQVTAAAGVPEAQNLSFSLSRAAAVSGGLVAGERIDVLATYGSGSDAYTAFVVRGVPLLAVTGVDGGPVDGGGDVLLTVAVSALEDVQSLGHAVNTAEVFVTRSTATPDGAEPAPGAYRSGPRESGPRPDPAAATGAGASDGGASDEADRDGADGASDDAGGG